MEESKNLIPETKLPPEILSLRTLYRLNIIYALFIFHGNRTATAKAMDMSVRGLRDNLKDIEKKNKVFFPAGGIHYRTQYLKTNHNNEVDEKYFIEKSGPQTKIEELKLFVSDFGFPYREILSEHTAH